MFAVGAAISKLYEVVDGRYDPHAWLEQVLDEKCIDWAKVSSEHRKSRVMLYVVFCIECHTQPPSNAPEQHPLYSRCGVARVCFTVVHSHIGANRKLLSIVPSHDQYHIALSMGFPGKKCRVDCTRWRAYRRANSRQDLEEYVRFCACALPSRSRPLLSGMLSRSFAFSYHPL